MNAQLLRSLVIAGAVVALGSEPCFSHGANGQNGGFVSGLLHPIFGLDHICAMIAVGLWGAFLGRPAIWILPIAFPLVMAFGGALGILHMPMIATETGIALSALVLGLCVALPLRPPIWVAAALVSAFAIFHGYAHGAEMPAAADAIAYAIGFVIATGMLHLCGIALGLLTKWPTGVYVVRSAGALISLGGVGFLFGAL
jgi:urease accessory protein